MNTTIWAVFLGFALDQLLGDPYHFPHPVRWIGSLIQVLEKYFRRIFPKTPQGEYFAGISLMLCVCVVSFCIPAILLALLGLVSHWLSFAMEVVLCYYILAARSLQKESMKVYDKLEENDLAGARKAVSMIVGRDTENLTASQVAKAAVETVAENTSDGVVAPLFFMMLGGAPLGFLYKGINTMDSMIGYKNKRYLHFGKAAAKLDDAVNYIPARISGLLMVLSAYLIRLDGKNAWKIFKRDRRNHASPNSAQTEAACAGALRVQLAGDAYYFGELYHKPTIGDALRPIEHEDIPRANNLMLATSLISMLLFALIHSLIY